MNIKIKNKSVNSSVLDSITKTQDSKKTDKPLTKLKLSAAIVLSSLLMPAYSAVAQSAVDVGKYELVKGSVVSEQSATKLAQSSALVNLDEYTLEGESKKLPFLQEDVSGVTYNVNTNTLFMVGSYDGDEAIYETDLSGEEIRRIQLINGFNDVKGIVHMYQDTYAVVQKASRDIVIFTIDPDQEYVDYGNNSNVIKILNETWESFGLEGITFNQKADSQKLFAVNEKSPKGFYSISDFSVGSQIGKDNALVDNDGNACGDSPSPLGSIANLSGVHHANINSDSDENSNSVLLLSRESQALIELNDCKEASRLKLSDNGANGTLTSAINQAEGVTMDNNGKIYIVGESNELYVFSKQAESVDAPSDLTATANGTTSIGLTWTDGSNNETGFVIERASTVGSTWVEAGRVGPNVTSFDNEDLSPSTLYFYRVKAVTESASSDYAPVVYTKTLDELQAPSDLSLKTVESNSVEVSWSDNSSNEAGFVVQRWNNGWIDVATVDSNVTSYVETDLEVNKLYYYKVKAILGEVSSPFTAYKAIRVLEGGQFLAPSNLILEATSSSSIQLNWADNSDNETGFVIERFDLSTFKWSEVARVESNVTTFDDEGLNPGTKYAYKVKAVKGEEYSGYSRSQFMRTDNEILAQNLEVSQFLAPSNLILEATSSSIQLNWTDNSTGETGFVIERFDLSSFKWSEVARVGSNVTSFADEGLDSGTKYAYKVKAINGGSSSGYSRSVFMTTDNDTLAPARPISISVSSLSASSIRVGWTDSSNNETGFVIERSEAANGRFSEVGRVGANITSFEDEGLVQGKRYYYKVKAVNGSSYSAPTGINSTETLSGLPVPSPLSLKAVASDSVEISWQDNSNDETGFVIQRFNNGWKDVATVNSDVTSYVETGLQASRLYHYQVKAIKGGLSSRFTPLKSITLLGVE